MKLFSIESDPKTSKGSKRGVLTAVQYLAPAWLSGRDVCQYKSPGCTLVCLNTAGQFGGMQRTQDSRIKKTNFFFDERTEYFAQLIKEIEAFLRQAKKLGMVPAVRLNGTSDMPWHKMPFTINGQKFANIMQRFSDVQFYDYTKRPAYNETLPDNYHLTFSKSETNDAMVKDAITAGMNVAIVFKNVPTSYQNREVIDGALDDLRFLAKQGVIVGLKAKGKARQDTTGFVVQG